MPPSKCPKSPNVHYKRGFGNGAESEWTVLYYES